MDKIAFHRRPYDGVTSLFDERPNRFAVFVPEVEKQIETITDTATRPLYFGSCNFFCGETLRSDFDIMPASEFLSAPKQPYGKALDLSILFHRHYPSDPCFTAFTHLASKEAGQLLFDPPYEHQAKALEATMGDEAAGTGIVVTTGTGSGKTEAFLLPILARLADEATYRQSHFAKRHFERCFSIQ